MNDNTPNPDGGQGATTYRPPAITHLGTLAELTQKQVGAADGATFLGVDIGSI